jgi:hypothetical protein
MTLCGVRSKSNERTHLLTPYLSLIASVILLLTALEPFSGRRAICWWRVPRAKEGEGEMEKEREWRDGETEGG